MNSYKSKCLKCGTDKVTKKTNNRNSVNALFCKSCTSSSYNHHGGVSLIDEWLSEHLPYYNPKGPFILKCECGTHQQYSVKYSLVRVLRTTGKCGVCSKGMNRKGWAGTMKPRTQEYIDKQRLNQYNKYHNTNYTNVNDIPQDRNWKRYKDRVHDRTKVSLKIHNPQMYKKWEENKYDGTDMNALTIDHIKSVRDCFDDGWTVDQACNINNLQLLTMKENIEKEHLK
tara:strand:- start:1946 stop:2626 length:681 start_codon:yes stop_codon:yes gene_type:complete